MDGLPFHPEIEAATADQILPMVRADLGVGFVPQEFLAGAQDVSVIGFDDSSISTTRTPPLTTMQVQKR